LLYSSIGATIACVPIATSKLRHLTEVPSAPPVPAISVEPLIPDPA
jgi:hypothetical protein